MCVFTGHISPRESIALAECAKDYGIDEVVFSHPDSNSVGATRDEIREMNALGAVCEFCALGFLYQRISPKTALEIISDVTPDRAIMTTDYFYDWVPPGAEMMRMLIGTFLRHGVGESDIRKMVKTNPERLLRRANRPPFAAARTSQA
jgi:predicted metal-dependent phosphotriesterase family hydrolase